MPAKAGKSDEVRGRKALTAGFEHLREGDGNVEVSSVAKPQGGGKHGSHREDRLHEPANGQERQQGAQRRERGNDSKKVSVLEVAQKHEWESHPTHCGMGTDRSYELAVFTGETFGNEH